MSKCVQVMSEGAVPFQGISQYAASSTFSDVQPLVRFELVVI